MLRLETWAEALNINPHDLEEWKAKAPSDIPLPVWCIQNGFLAAHEYLIWASEFYSLPVLSSAFFESDAFSPEEVWNPSSEANWRPWCFPVSQWENVTFIACTEPPQSASDSKVHYVLADPRVMQEIWESHFDNIVKDPEPPPMDPPAGIKLEPVPQKFTLNIGNEAILARDPFANHQASAPAKPKPQPPPDRGVTSPSAKAARRGPFRGRGHPLDTSEGAKLVVHSCILRCDGAEAILFKWDRSLTPKNAKAAHLSQAVPSFLRIVTQTLLPYHGFLVDTPAHREFFIAMGLTELPGCVTAVPLKQGDSLLGVLMALGSEDHQAIDNLRIVEEAAENLMSCIGPSWLKAS